MANKIYDLIIFGATGYTGKNVVQYVARSAQEIGNVKWAISGRDESKPISDLVTYGKACCSHRA